MEASLASALAGFCASASTVVFFPLEVARVRLMVSDGHSRNHLPYFSTAYQALHSLYKDQGLSSLYKGWQFTVLSNFAWMAYFFFYSQAKLHYSKEFESSHTDLYRFLIAAEAAVLARIVTNPMWVVKTRLMLQQFHVNWHSDLIEAVRKVYKVDGLKGYWQGLYPGLLLSSNGAVQLYLYETLKEKLGEHYWSVSVAGAFSKLGSGVLLYPLQTVMTRLQQEQYSFSIPQHSGQLTGPVKGEPFFHGMLNCLHTTFKREGLGGFYRGIWVHVLRLVPANALFFVVYEEALKRFSR